MSLNDICSAVNTAINVYSEKDILEVSAVSLILACNNIPKDTLIASYLRFLIKYNFPITLVQRAFGDEMVNSLQLLNKIDTSTYEEKLELINNLNNTKYEINAILVMLAGFIHTMRINHDGKINYKENIPKLIQENYNIAVKVINSNIAPQLNCEFYHMSKLYNFE